MKRIFLTWLVVLPLAVSGQDLPKSELTVAAGYLFEGSAYVWVPNRYGSFGDTYVVKADYVGFFSNVVGLGGYVSYALPYYGIYESVTMMELGMVCKARFKAGEKFVVKFPLYIGYRGYGGGAGRALAVNFSGVLQYQGEKLRPFLDVGFISQPVGGNDYSDITFAPIMQVSAGLAFTF